MARGWESKSVEDQMEEAQRSQGETEWQIQAPEERERQHKVESLKLERSRLTEQLERARSETHQRIIQQSLKAIEAEIAALSAT
jgi:chromosome segregation ATPase